ncbi:MAG: Hint domain-containing protein [Paracoccaceae bacterium]
MQGFVPGGIVLTLDGALPVEHLVPGDRIVTRDTGMAILRGVERFGALCDSVAVRAGTLGADRPDRA